MRSKNILLKELFKRKYRNRIKQSKKGKGSFKRLKKIKVEDWKKEREKKKVKERRKWKQIIVWDVAITSQRFVCFLRIKHRFRIILKYKDHQRIFFYY